MSRRNQRNSPIVPDQAKKNQEEHAEQRWIGFLNANFGLLGFPLGLACLTTKTPWINALLALLFIVVLRFNGRRLLPEHFRSGHHRKTHSTWKHSLKFWAGTLPAVFGYVYLCFIGFGQPLVTSFKANHVAPWFVWLVEHYIGAPP